MGNESSTTVGLSSNSSEDDEFQIECLVPLRKSALGNPDLISSLKPMEQHKQAGVDRRYNDDDSAGYDNDDDDEAFLCTRPDRKFSLRRAQHFSEGLLRGTTEKNNQDNNVCRDSILDAVAAGSAVRKARQERLERIRQQQQQPQQQQQQHYRPRSSARGASRLFADDNNEWKTSLRRLAKTAASTAKTVVHVAAPVITDARQVVLSSATEFAQDVGREWKKADNDNQNNDSANNNDTQSSENSIELSSKIEKSKCSDHHCSKNGEIKDNLVTKTTQKKEEFCEKANNDKGASSNATEVDKNTETPDQMSSTTMYIDTTTGPQNKDTTNGTVYTSFELTFEEKKETDEKGEIDDASRIEMNNFSPKQCIIEELQIMEEEFESQIESVVTQIESVLASQSDARNDDDKPKIRRLLSDDDMSDMSEEECERSTEITFFDKDDSLKQITSEGCNNLQCPLNSINESVVFIKESEKVKKECEGALVKIEPKTHSKVTPECEDNGQKLDQNDQVLCDTNDQPGSEKEEKILVDLESKTELEGGDKRSEEDTKSKNKNLLENNDELGDNKTAVAPEDFEEGTQSVDKEGNSSEEQHRECQDLIDNKDQSSIEEGCDKDQDEDPIVATAAAAAAEPKIRTRSGRIVKPVRRLVDGCESSVGGENQYGRADGHLADEEENTAIIDESENITQTAEDLKNTNNLQLGSPKTRYEKDAAVDEAITTHIDALSHQSINNQKKKPLEVTADHLPLAMENTNIRYKRNDTFVERVKTMTSPLFGLNGDSLYQNEEVNTVRDSNGKKSEEKVGKKIPKLPSEQPAFVQSSEHYDFKDKKSVVKFVVTKLTGFDIEVKEKSHKIDLFDPSNDFPVADSIFDKQTQHTINSSSSSSLSSPPEIDMCLQIESKDDHIHLKDDTNDLFPLFDFIPDKGEVSQDSSTEEESNKLKSSISEEDARLRTIVKQGSTASQNDSLGSFSTHQKSSKSMPFSTWRSSRRQRRQGSKMSLSLSNTQSSKSPYMTPVENRSLVDDKHQIESKLVDPGVQMVGWDTDIEANFPSVPDTEDMTEAFERSELFHETLAAFSSLENIDFLRDYSLSESTEVPEATSSLMWRQLIANWKHSESCKAMLTRPSSIQLSALAKQVGFFYAEDDVSSSLSTIQFQFDSGNVAFSNDFVSSDAYSLLRCANVDYCCVADDSFLVLTRYLCDIGPGISAFEGKREGMTGKEPLRHNLSDTIESGEHGGSLTITDIHIVAKAQLSNLERIINCIVNYSTQNDPSSTDLECNGITSSSGIKDYTSIRRKARIKYNDDVSQVKDVLRGEITFPDEAALICGLYSLHSLKNGRTNFTPSFQIVRLKNLFRTTNIGNEIYNALPTGYRHILINVKLECGLIAELQFQMAQLFDVIGAEGYLLHQDIVSYEIENGKRPTSSTSDKNSIQSEKGVFFDVSSSEFVRSILKLPTDLAIIPQHGQMGLNEKTNDESDASNTTTAKAEATTKPNTNLVSTAQMIQNSENEKYSKHLSKVPVGGIVALAAQAALKTSEKQTTQEDTPKSPATGIAALAAQAALNKSKKQTAQEDAKPPVVGIAALAAKAALKKSEKQTSQEDVPKPMPGGIAALAAQAAFLKKIAAENEKLSKNSSDMNKVSSMDITALAAEAALKKIQTSKDVKDKSDATAFRGSLAARATLMKSPKGGIMSLADQIKTAKEMEDIDDSSSEIDVKDKSDAIALRGSLGTQAALMKSPRGGIMSLADQIKATKEMHDSDDSSSEMEEKAPKLPVLGIAALAAQSALKKSKKQVTQEATPKAPVGGIAALAAQAALEKSKNQANQDNGQNPTGGGIAELAAQAALKKSEKQAAPMPPVGGIAALAAQAALKKSKKQGTQEDIPQAPVGGIAALAAQAALKKSKKQGTQKDVPQAPVGGIAALAAQAALKKSKNQASQEDVPQAPVGGIAALAAQAALKKSKKQGTQEDVPQAPVGGIAALAAQAALKKSIMQAAPKPPAGEIAALAAQAALEKPEKEVFQTKVSSANEMAVKKPSNMERPKRVNPSMMALISAVFEAGILEATSNPRDVPALYCLHLLASALQKRDEDSPESKREDGVLLPMKFTALSRKLLLRSLFISNQATSIGMIGWLEYGSSNLFDRALNLPFEVLKQISCNMAAEKDWAKASDVLCSLLLRCEQHLPRCHPTTLGAMLDLAGALTEAHNFDSAKSIISQTLDLLSGYLSEAESLFFDRRYFELFYANDADHVVSFDDCVDPVGIMQAFCKKFQEDLSRDFLKVLGPNHRITLLNHSLVADSFSVLANCLSASEEQMCSSKFNTSAAGTFDRNRTTTVTLSRYYWSLSHAQYDIALRGWIRAESLIHPNATSVAFSIARCLRELGKTKQAIKLLETLSSCLEQKLDEQIATTKAVAEVKKTSSVSPPPCTFIVPLNDTKMSSSRLKDIGPSFISRRRNFSMSMPMSISKAPSTVLENDAMVSCEREQTAVLCFWMMAVLTAEESPDERGRSRALSLLHTASLTLQRVLSKDSKANNNGSASVVDDQTRLVCLDLYQKIEGEAFILFEPLERIPLAKNYKTKSRDETTNNDEGFSSTRKQMVPWEVLTPMRQKRWWTSPRSRINQSAPGPVPNTDNSSTSAGNFGTDQANRKSESAFIKRI